MRFNRRLRRFKAISFDLDDTLYSNRPIMYATEQAMLDFFKQHVEPIINAPIKFDSNFWWRYRLEAIQSAPQLKHDVGALRCQTYELGLLDLGLSLTVARDLAMEAYQHFMHHRCDFSVSEDVHKLLGNLAAKWPLVAISNGNVDTQKIGIQSYFSHTYHANLTQAQKPEPTMFNNACFALRIVPRDLLHVGDCGISDIYGAMAAGCQSAWVSSYDVGKPVRVLPDIELNEVTELATFT